MRNVLPSLLLFGGILIVSPADRCFAQSGRPETSSAAEFDPKKISKLAVLVSTSEGTTGATKFRMFRDEVGSFADQHRAVEDVFLASLLSRGHVIAARSDVESVFKEKNLQNSGLTEDLAANVGKVLNVQAVLVVRLSTSTELQNAPLTGLPPGKRPVPSVANTKVLIGSTTVGARLVDAQTGNILWSGTNSATSPVPTSGSCNVLLRGTAVALAEAFPLKPLDDPVTRKAINPTAFPKMAIVMLNGGTSQKSSFPFRRYVRTEQQTEDERKVEDAFIQVALKKGYGLVARSDLQAVLKEQQFQNSGFSEENAVEIGKILNVPALLLVRITESASESYINLVRKSSVISRLSLGARLVDVKNGEILWSHNDIVIGQAGKIELSYGLTSLAKNVAGFLPPVDSKEVLLQQGERLVTLGHFTAANHTLRTLVKDFPDSSEAKKATNILKKISPK